jgi:SAM-dependent methyltransferase
LRAIAQAEGAVGGRRDRISVRLRAIELGMALRGALFAGTRFVCPCCGWHVRGFTSGGASFRTRDLSYCPRCNAKARHRRIWLFLERRTTLFTDPTRLLEISPKYSFARRFVRMPNIDFLGVDLGPRPHVAARMDLTALAVRSGSFDAVICVHVLEEIADDRRAMREIHRVLRPGGWALISVPTDLDRPTYEDASITAPADRQRAFGEKAHVRVYGHDIVDRLQDAGFVVRVDLARDVDPRDRDRFGLRDDENIFWCTKP